MTLFLTGGAAAARHHDLQIVKLKSNLLGEAFTLACSFLSKWSGRFGDQELEKRNGQQTTWSAYATASLTFLSRHLSCEFYEVLYCLNFF